MQAGLNLRNPAFLAALLARGAGVSLNWTSQTASGSKLWNSVCYGTKFVAVARDGGSATAMVMTSSDGITWANQNASIAGTWYGVCYGNSLYVAVSADGQCMTSSDAVTWTTRTMPGTSYHSVTYGNGVYVAVGPSGNVASSTDAITWNARSDGVARNWESVCWGNNLFVAVASNNAILSTMSSSDGTTWTEHTAVVQSTWTGVTYSAALGLYIAVAFNLNALSMWSSDGANWTSGTVAAPTATWITLGNGLLVSVGQGTPGSAYSQDGKTFTTAAAAPDGGLWNSVAYGNGTFVAVREDGGGAARVMTAPY